MGRAHTNALKAKIQEIPILAGSKTVVTIAPHGTEFPYCVIHPSNGANTQERAAVARNGRQPRFTLHLVGESGEQVQLLLDLVEEKLFPGGVGIVLPVEGETAFPLWFESPIPIQVQTDPQPTIAYAVAECGWKSLPVGGV